MRHFKTLAGLAGALFLASADLAHAQPRGGGGGGGRSGGPPAGGAPRGAPAAAAPRAAYNNNSNYNRNYNYGYSKPSSVWGVGVSPYGLSGFYASNGFGIAVGGGGYGYGGYGGYGGYRPYGYGYPGNYSGYYRPYYGSSFYNYGVPGGYYGVALAPTIVIRPAYSAPSYYGSSGTIIAQPAESVAPALNVATVAPTPAADAALLEVFVPREDAEVWLGNSTTTQKGIQRFFRSPTLEAETDYTYTVTARWTEDGKPVEKALDVKVRAGKTSLIDFRPPEPEPAPAPTKSK